MKRIRGIMIRILMLMLIWQISVSVGSADEPNYVRDSDQTVYSSENGLLGTAAKCILSAQDGRIWVGAYTGLYVYDGTEFSVKYIEERPLVANCLMQSADGTIWIGTNGDGVYCYRDDQFQKCDLGEVDEKANIVRDIVELPDGTIWIGTRKGLYYVSEEQCQEKKCEFLENDSYIQDLEGLDDGRLAGVTRNGKLFYVDQGEVIPIVLGKAYSEKKLRSVGHDAGYLYVGTTDHEVFRITEDGTVKRRIFCSEMTSMNAFYKIEEGVFWVCSDTGIGILRGDTLEYQKFPLSNSVEDVCMDYQGDFWFASSRQGVLKISPSIFADLGYYLGNNQTVNTILPDRDRIYLGTDEGLFCYVGSQEIADDPLVQRLRGQRVRQIFRTGEEVWAVTYQSGIYVMTEDGKIRQYTSVNSGLTTNQIRCMREGNNGVFWIGTEDGLFRMDQKQIIEQYDVSPELDHERIMDVYENPGGILYIATDGLGIFAAGSKNVKRITKERGLLSNVVMKMTPSKLFEGVWAVTGSEICLIGFDGTVSQMRSIPAANCLDLLLDDSGTAYIIAGNGFFKTQEKELFKQSGAVYEKYTWENGLPIDFTANAFPVIYEDNVYLCGTDGAACFHHSFTRETNDLHLYVNEIRADGEPAYMEDGKVILKSDVMRLTFDVRLLQYTKEEFDIAYCLSGMEHDFNRTSGSNLKEISYTNIGGGNYTYMLRVYEKGTDNCLCELNVPVAKNYAYLENPQVRVLIYCMLVMFTCFVVSAVMHYMDIRQKQREKKSIEEQRREELARTAYIDVLTGVNNRNLFEMDKEAADMEKLTTIMTVGVSFWDYLQENCSASERDRMLTQAVCTMKAHISEQTRIYRIAETVFLLWFEEPVNAEEFTLNVKAEFAKLGSDDIPRVLSVGAAYNDKRRSESIETLVDHCEEFRRMDEKHSYRKFVQGNVTWL